MRRELRFAVLTAAVLTVMAMAMTATAAVYADDDPVAKIEQELKGATSVDKIFSILSKVIVATVVPLITLGLAIFMGMRYHNNIRRMVGKAAFGRAGLGVKSVLRKPTPTGSILVKIDRLTFDGFWSVVQDNGKIEEEVFDSWIGFETQSVDVIRNQDYPDCIAEAV